jgi:hypothetical protein
VVMGVVMGLVLILGVLAAHFGGYR